MRTIAALLLLPCLFLTTACPYPPSPGAYQGGVIGGGTGAVAGALLDRENPWRGGIIGGVLGAFFGATLGDIADRAGREAARHRNPVEYRTQDGRGIYRADPMEYDAATTCTKVHERVWEDGRLVRDQVKEICEGSRTRPGY